LTAGAAAALALQISSDLAAGKVSDPGVYKSRLATAGASAVFARIIIEVVT